MATVLGSLCSKVAARGLRCGGAGAAALRLAPRTAAFSSLPQRFADPWFRKYDKATEGYVDSTGFVCRLPLRLESSEVFVHGFVDAQKMWAEFDDEQYIPVLVGGKAVVSIWFNNFIDTDCGGEYWETWYNTFVTPKGEPQVDAPAEGGPMAAIADPRALVFLQRVVCGDTPRNPGAAMKAITGGREIFGFPKHPDLGQITLAYQESGGKKVGFSFDAKHSGNDVVNLSIRLPEADEGAMELPLEAESGPDSVISCPRLGGSHKGHNGAKQVRYGQAFKCTQYLKPWDPATDTLTFGTDAHYAAPIKRWDFTPILKVHAPDFKIAAFKPVGWISGAEADTAVSGHEAKLAAGTLGGAL
mmetsp:Transcript_72879/g.225363  ORF Transcript_72879/g.225363 Transcript_72879/m.225363 type:complete len:358 (-) Transcript_72879:144-1217(-)